ncbi:MAG: transcriptional repressor LexA [Candidatus Tectomicrobia bacterium]|uniref:LexA repressor n=1 Tax=Tectimicrobiota bacterium TaxID=2528274 RepID=A0A932CQ65_UNCTE|nr:transcriptional repressor LexA [Candidatus Tectomicrobia bacterium]
MTRPNLTQRQEEVLRYITEVARQQGYPPTLRQIGEHFGMSSSNAVRTHLRALEKKGYIRRQARTSRGIELLVAKDLRPAAEETGVEVPVVGRVPAGVPLLAEENTERTLFLDRSLLRAEGCFALRVMGDSMIEDGILDGDYVLVRPQPTANNGEIVVALVEGEATVKRFYREKERIRLQPANARLEPIFAREVQIVGRVVALVRPKI